MRCAYFHRNFPTRRITSRILTQVMKKAGMKKKKILVLNAPQRKSMRVQEFEDKTLLLDEWIDVIQA